MQLDFSRKAGLTYKRQCWTMLEQLYLYDWLYDLLENDGVI